MQSLDSILDRMDYACYADYCRMWLVAIWNVW